MRFIELHRHSDGKPVLINLDEIMEIRPGDDDRALVEWRQGYRYEPMALPVEESYVEIRGMLAVSRILIR